MTLAQLQARKDELFTQIKLKRDAFTAAGNKWPDEEARANWEKLNKDYDENEALLTEARTGEAVAARMTALEAARSQSTNTRGIGLEDRSGNPAPQTGRAALPTEEIRSLALAGFVASQLGMGVNERQAEAMRECRYNSGQSELQVQPYGTSQLRSLQRSFQVNHASRAASAALESRDLSSVVLGSGGALIPDSFVRALEVNMLAYGGLLQVAEQLVTASGEEMTWPTADDTSNEGARIGEGIAIGASVDPSFGGVKWLAYKYTSKPILVPYELLEDAVFELPSLLGAMLGERLGRKLNRDCTTGTGANGPKGIVTCATAGATAASATAITFDELITLEHSVDPAYRANAGYMMHDNVILALRLLKDLEGRYLWVNGTNPNMKDTLNGHPLTINQNMASAVTTGQITVLFGQFSRYKVRKAGAYRLYRLQERYRDNDQDGFVAFMRADGNLLSSGTSPVKKLTQA